jgi:ribosomal protein S18 acetylase RimI-like enzyme
MLNHSIRNILPDDIPFILEIQRLVYNIKLNEPKEVFFSFIREPRNKCFLFLEGDTIIGYCIAHPYSIDKLSPPELHTESPTILPEMKDWFIHDMAFHPSFHTMGYGNLLYNHFLNSVSKTSSLSLVAVNGANTFWKKYGFIEYNKENMESYTEDAIYMIYKR